MALDLDSLTIGEAKQLAALFGGGPAALTQAKDGNVGKYCVIRTYSAGVHVGIVNSRNGREIELRDARRIWRWEGANTLHEIALRGLSSASKVSEQIAAITLTEVVEILPCTTTGEASLRSAAWKK